MPMNFAKTGLLLVLLTAIFVAAGAAIGGTQGMVIAFVMALAMNLFSLWNADTLVLRMYSAQEVDAQSAPAIFRPGSAARGPCRPADATRLRDEQSAAECFRDRTQP